MKYKTLAELKAAYDSGELSKEHKLTIDEDNLYVLEPDPERMCDHRGDDDDMAYAYSQEWITADILREALDLLNIPYKTA